MLNRNDRIALRRNRAAVSWLCLISLLLVIWIISIYSNTRYLQSDLEMHSEQLKNAEIDIELKTKKIDSLSKVIFNLQNPPKDTIKPVTFKPKKEIKDTNLVFKSKPDTSIKILKDSLK